MEFVDKLINDGRLHEAYHSDAIHKALDENNLGALKFLVEQGVKIRKENYTLLNRVISLHYFPFFEFIVASGVNLHYGDNELMRLMIQYGTIDFVKCAIEHGASVNSKDVSSDEEFEYRNPLVNAVMKNDFDLVKLLVENGADVQAHHSHALRVSKLPWISRYLVEYGAGPL